MSNINIESEELENLINEGLEELYIVREKVQAAITKFHAIKGTWINKQQLKNIK